MNAVQSFLRKYHAVPANDTGPATHNMLEVLFTKVVVCSFFKNMVDTG